MGNMLDYERANFEISVRCGLIDRDAARFVRYHRGIAMGNVSVGDLLEMYRREKSLRLARQQRWLYGVSVAHVITMMVRGWQMEHHPYMPAKRMFRLRLGHYSEDVRIDTAQCMVDNKLIEVSSRFVITCYRLSDGVLSSASRF